MSKLSPAEYCSNAIRDGPLEHLSLDMLSLHHLIGEKLLLPNLSTCHPNLAKVEENSFLSILTELELPSLVWFLKLPSGDVLIFLFPC